MPQIKINVKFEFRDPKTPKPQKNVFYGGKFFWPYQGVLCSSTLTFSILFFTFFQIPEASLDACATHLVRCRGEWPFDMIVVQMAHSKKTNHDLIVIV